jgi:predicted metal-dependent hydrolase
VPWLEVDGRWIEVPVRESKRARLLRIVSHADGKLEVVVPPSTSERSIDRLLTEHHTWIRRQYERAQQYVNVLGLQRPDVVWLHGEARPVPRVPSTEKWYRARARAALTEATAREAARLGVEYAQIAVRDQRTRWGSCSSRGTLSYNWRLVLAPIEILEYVVVHELCHLVEHNHSRAFWRLVEQARPSYREERAWLHVHGAELLAYVPPAPAAVAA